MSIPTACLTLHIQMFTPEVTARLDILAGFAHCHFCTCLLGKGKQKENGYLQGHFRLLQGRAYGPYCCIQSEATFLLRYMHN